MKKIAFFTVIISTYTVLAISQNAVNTQKTNSQQQKPSVQTVSSSKANQSTQTNKLKFSISSNTGEEDD